MAIDVCEITCTLHDFSDEVPADLVAELVIKNEKGFYHGDTFIPPGEKRAAFDEDGVAILEVIETTTPGELMQIMIEIKEGRSKRTVMFEPAMIPDEVEADLSDITVPRITPF